MKHPSTAVRWHQFSMMRSAIAIGACVTFLQFGADYLGLVQATPVVQWASLAFALILAGVWFGLGREVIGTKMAFVSCIITFYLYEIVVIPQRVSDHLAPLWFIILIGVAYVFGNLAWGLVMTLLSGLGFLYVVMVSPHIAATAEIYTTGCFALLCASGIFYIVKKETNDLVKRLDILSELDALTGLLNRRALEARYAALATAGRPGDRQICVAIIDIDDFKLINDNLGHACGDAVIVALSDVLKSSFRADDLVARIGGDEFVVVALDCDLRSARKLFEAAKRRFEELLLKHDWTVDEVIPSLSIGLCACRMQGASMSEALKDADRLMYQAKQGGKNAIAAQG